MSSRPSFAKRQKEQARREKRRAKLERAQQRKREKQLSAESGEPAASDLMRSPMIFDPDSDSDPTSDPTVDLSTEEPAGS